VTPQGSASYESTDFEITTNPRLCPLPRGDPALPRLNVPDLVFFGSFVTAASWDLPVQIDDDSTGDP
jgi:hypothetical protein